MIFENIKINTHLAESAELLLKKYAKNDCDGKAFKIEFINDAELNNDTFRIEVGDDDILVFGNTAVAFNAAVGHILRRQNQSLESATVTFENNFRSVYFANHFYNYYHASPIDEVCDYIESLALWGQSVLSLWFDMHHFKSINDPDAQAMLEKMNALYKKAKSLGMKTCLSRLANEYYCEIDDKTLLAENSLEGGRYKYNPCGFYYTELCPSKPQAEARLMQSLDELLKALKPAELDYLVLWPYDQGGCTCKECYPWGSNGFFNLSKKQAEFAKLNLPNIKVILSCWRFDHFTNGEWSSLLPKLQNDGAWVDALMVDIGSHLPEYLKTIGKPVYSFPEISMRGATPWGGFGANPFPVALAEQFKETRSLCQGGSLYSEGIFEDINKAVALSLMQNSDTDPKQIVLEYCNYHFGTTHAEAICDIVMRLENTLSRGTYMSNGERNDYPSGKPLGLHSYKIKNTDDVQSIARDMQELDKSLPQSVRDNARYKMIFVRAVGDAALLKNDGMPNQETDDIFSQLIEIYHSENAFYFVSPVTRNSIMENRGEGV